MTARRRYGVAPLRSCLLSCLLVSNGTAVTHCAYGATGASLSVCGIELRGQDRHASALPAMQHTWRHHSEPGIPDPSQLSYAKHSPSASSSAPNYYVATDGNDRNNGSAARPWATITYADSVISAGATVHVAPGTYVGPVVTKKNGTETARILFISDKKWGARIVWSGATERIWENKGSYVDIVNFDISGSARTGIGNGGSYVRILGNHVHNITNPEGCMSRGGAGISDGNYRGTDNDIIGNLVHDIGGDPSVKCNKIHGIYHSNLRGHIYNNIVYRAQGWGIHLWHAASNVVVANNLVFQNGEGGIVIGAGDAPGDVTNDSTTVINNISIYNGVWFAQGPAIAEEGVTGIHNYYSNNLIFGNKKDRISLRNKLVANNTIVADPGLVNYQPDGRGDYHLRAGSPAIDAGASRDAPTDDFDGVARPKGRAWDIGPYEFVSRAR